MGYEKVLLTLDGSELAELALQYVTRVATPGADIHVLSVVEDHTAETNPLVSLMNAEYALASSVYPSMQGTGLQSEVKSRIDYLARVSANLQARGYQLTLDARPGKGVDTIVNVACEGCEVLMTATRGRSGLGKFVLGSVAQAVLHKAPCPVLIVPARSPRKSDKESTSTPGCILVALDGSAQSEAVLPEVEKLLQSQPCKVILLRVAPAVNLEEAARQMDPHIERATELCSDDYDLLSNLSELQVRRYLDTVGKRLEQAGATPIAEVSFYKPADEILFFAHHFGADLIAMATHGRTGLNRLMQGSVTENVLHHASCPVLIVRTPAQTEPGLPEA